jgi:hypothetical protein
MRFTGTLIEDLMATVARAEQRAQSDGVTVVESMVVKSMVADPSLVEPLLVAPWFASVQEDTDYDSKFIGVA